MEILTTIVSFILLSGLLGSPFLILFTLNKRNIRFKLLAYLTYGIMVTIFITFTFAWWVDASNQILLSHYGYNFDGWNETERLAKVGEENLTRVERIKISMLGIGWPLKAIMGYIFYSPYLLLVYLIDYTLKKNKKERIPNIV
ncbi:hypothetical protein ACD591_05305 [Rufibacter glacialis]|uniref:Uncharacterized protein n=1 Tax=Rufibacter glacialis TaxID=1259555 RepID=A0A5M8QJ32_9BACT|nr:hypothetical protein [Rufibacter glacialis]KAA6434763.1 hypothetical protein FOE74_11360 [Rufibacter glacialis]GGK72229.1 hypothetical protein GCM10011405_20570 [Rufibacter glacialis]